jgi:hypothetical protein
VCGELLAHALAKDAPVSRPVEQIGRIVSQAMVGGLHIGMPESGFWYTQGHSSQLSSWLPSLQRAICEPFSSNSAPLQLVPAQSQTI